MLFFLQIKFHPTFRQEYSRQMQGRFLGFLLVVIGVMILQTLYTMKHIFIKFCGMLHIL